MPRSAFLRRRSATIASPEDERIEELEDSPESTSPAGDSGRNSSSGSSSLTGEVLSKSLTGAQTRKLQKSPSSRDRHKRYSSVDFSAFSPRGDDSLDAADASAASLTSPSKTSFTESISPSVTSERKQPLGKLKRVSSRIWGARNSGTAEGTSSEGSSSESSQQAIARARKSSVSPSNGSHIVNSAQHAVAQELLPRRLVQGWFTNLHPSSAESLSSPQSSSNPTLGQRISSPLKNMTNSPRASTSNSQPTPTAGSSAGSNRLFDRKWMDKAANYLFDTDANVDKCPDEIWLLGVCHPGYREPSDSFDPDSSLTPASPTQPSKSALKRRRRKASNSATAADRFSPSLSPSPSSQSTHTSSSTSSLTPSEAMTPTASTTLPHPTATDTIQLPTLAQTAGWPPSFFLDFTSRVQLTYRSGFPPIVVPTEEMSQQLPSIANGSSPGGGFKEIMGSIANTLGRRGDADGLTSDAGWGCMLRTGQSLLANALAKHHLGREWRRPLPKPTAPSPNSEGSLVAGSQTQYPPDYAKYARLVTWFLDDPAPTSPFSVHRFALVGKKLGKEVGQWFGPSTAAGAIKALCQDFPAAQMGVAAAVDGTIYLPDIVAASESWSKPVLILLNLRLGLSGVNPIYYPTVKSLFTFPQSVGIAGGRPSSSYYFVGSQADSLFYIDPHYSRPAVPIPRLKPDGQLLDLALHQPLSPEHVNAKGEEDWEQVRRQFEQRPVTPPPSNAPKSTPPTVEITSDESMISEEDSWVDTNQEVSETKHTKQASTSTAASSQPPRPPLSAASSRSAPSTSASITSQPQTSLDDFYTRAYAPSDLASFHPERVRKMALSGLDPSMLVGFLVRSQEELDDWLQRSDALKPALFSVQRHVPGWAKPGGAPQSRQTDDSATSLVDAGRSDSWDISDSEEDLGVPESSSKASTQFSGSPQKPQPHRQPDSDEEDDDFADGTFDRSAHTIGM